MARTRTIGLLARTLALLGCCAAALASAADPPVLVVRLVAADGTPLREALVHLHWRAKNASATTVALTSADGRCTVAVDPRFAAGGVLLVLERHEHGRVTGRLLDCGSVRLGELKAGPNDCGDVRLVPEPLAAAGTVVDEAGTPLPGVRLVCTEAQGSVRHVASDADGRFAIAMRPPHPFAVRIGVDDDAWFFAADPLDAREVALDAPPQRLVLRRAARVLVPTPGLPAELLGDLQVECTSRSGSHWAAIDARTRHLHVPAGTWDLHFRLRGHDEPLHVVRGVRADAGVEAHDARLLQLDWRAFLDVVTVRVLDRAGAPCEACTVWRVTGADRARGSLAPGGVCRLLAPAKGARLAVQYDDHPGVDLGLVTGERTVRPPDPFVLRLVLTRVPALPEGTELIGMLRSTAPGRSPTCLRFDADGIATTHTAWRGPHRLQLRLRRRGRDVEVPFEVAFDVPGDDQEQRVELTDAIRSGIETQAKQGAVR